MVCLCLAAAPGLAQWSAPIALPHDSAADLSCTAIAIDDSNLFAAWVSGYGHTEYEIRGSMYDADSARWTGLRQFAPRSAEIAMTGPALTADPLRGGIWVAFYKGSFPLDQDTWGVYTVFADSTGIGPPELAMPDTGVSTVVMRHNGAGEIGMVWTDITGMVIYNSAWFSQLDGDTWRDRQLVAGGMGLPLIDCFEPALCPDTGDQFFVAWSRIIYQVPSYDVHIAGLPDTTTLGVFPGSSPAIVSDLHGSLLESNVQAVNTDRFLLARSFRGGTWTDPETLSSEVTAEVRQRMCVDTEGLFWLIYCEGYSQTARRLVRYCKDDNWSAPETVATGGVCCTPVVISTYSGQLWAVWQGTDTDAERIFSARRLGRPGVAEESFKPQASSLKLECFPNPARSSVRFHLTHGPMDPLSTCLRVFDATGRLVRTLPAYGAGRTASSITWDGTDESGRRVRPGVYCVREPATGASAKVIFE